MSNAVGKPTLKDLVRVRDALIKNAVKPLVVKTAKQARKMTLADPAGHVWSVGEEYYRAETFSQRIYVRADK